MGFLLMLKKIKSNIDKKLKIHYVITMTSSSTFNYLIIHTKLYDGYFWNKISKS